MSDLDLDSYKQVAETETHKALAVPLKDIKEEPCFECAFDTRKGPLRGCLSHPCYDKSYEGLPKGTTVIWFKKPKSRKVTRKDPK